MQLKQTADDKYLKKYPHLSLTSLRVSASSKVTVNSSGPMKASLSPSPLRQRALGPRCSPLAIVFPRRRMIRQFCCSESYMAREPEEEEL